MAEGWFSMGGNKDVQQQQSSSSLLADWNSYASSQSPEESSSFSFDLESAFRSANDKVTDTFNVERHWIPEGRVLNIRLLIPILFDLDYIGTNNLQSVFLVSEGVRDLPGNIQSSTSNIPSGKALLYFGLFLASGGFFIFIAFVLFLPVMVVMLQKFAICFTLGCGFIIGSFFPLKGPKNHLLHMSSKERVPLTLGFVGSMVGTIYVSMVLHSYILSVLFSVIQVLALAYYVISYFPAGSVM